MKEKQHGSFYGLGIQIQKRMGKITVIAPMEGTPAYKMGIRAGDIITHIGDEEIKEETTTEDVVRKLRGPKGTTVAITIRRPGIAEPIRMTITRAEIPDAVGSLRVHAGARTGYILLRDFTHTSSRELTAAIEKLEKAGHEESSSSTSAATRAASSIRRSTSPDVFLAKGSKIVYTKGRTPSSAQDFYAPGEGSHFDQPLVVLSIAAPRRLRRSSPARIQDHDRGAHRRPAQLGQGPRAERLHAVLRRGPALTTARYYTPSGRWIQRDYSDLLAYVNPGDPDSGDGDGRRTLGSSAFASSAESSRFYTDADAPCTRRAESRRTHGPNVPRLQAAPQFLARYAFFNFAVD